MNFSDRQGLARELQWGAVDQRLRNAIWNAFLGYRDAVARGDTTFRPRGASSSGLGAWTDLLAWIWTDFLAEPRDVLGSERMPFLDGDNYLRRRFFALEWNEVYDFVEFIASSDGRFFAGLCNEALLRERAAYRLVEGRVVPIVDDLQRGAIESAVAASAGLPLVQEHLGTALARLADRPEPDCRNAAKEAISAVETLVGMIAGSPGATLDAGLKLIESRKLLPLHPSLVRSWGALYGYTSDAGIRHGLKDGQASVGLDEAVYVVVTCSAVVSYLIAVAAKTGVPIQ